MLKMKLADFELDDPLGTGTVGTIYRATNKKSGQTFALKILLPTVVDDPLISARFQREMVILEKLSHPHIVRYYGGGQEGKQWFYAMELVDGGNLKELIEQSGPLSWPEVVTIGTQLCSALQYAHNFGIIHRDLKPSNLYFTKDGELKLGDFGIALDTTSTKLTANGLTVGTYAYMSPEQIAGDDSITGKTDLYALGCLMFEMLTGQPPFQGDNFAQIFNQHLQSNIPSVRSLVPDCPAELETVIHSLMKKDPEERPFNARAVQGTLMNLGQTPISLQPDDEATDEDVAAADAGERGLERLKDRINRCDETPYGDVSWRSMALIALLLFGVVWAAWYFGG